MKSYYSITLVIAFATLMALLSVIGAARSHTDLSNANAAIVALSVGAIMLAYRLAQSEKRIAHLENRLENKQNNDKKSKPGDQDGNTK